MNKGVKKKRIRAIRWVACLFLIYTPDTLPAQTPDTDIFFAGDTIVSVAQDFLTETTPFKPVPRKASITAAIFPGLGQIYNRQYWKLPIVYGGFMGCAYAISWNNRTFQDYKNAYYSIMKDSKEDPRAEHPENWSENWMVFLPSYVDPATRLNSPTFHSSLKRGKDYFRRYRDLSIIISIALYGIVVADAYVDAQMFDFDVSTDLSLQITPIFIPETLYHARSYGINICMNF